MTPREAPVDVSALKVMLTERLDDRPLGAGGIGRGSGVLEEWGADEPWLGFESAGHRGVAGGVVPWVAARWRVREAIRRHPGAVVWIGCGGYPYVGWGDEWQDHGGAWVLGVTAKRLVDRVWAIERCVRCVAVAAVIADGRGLSFTQTRRLQLAAESSGGGGSSDTAVQRQSSAEAGVGLPGAGVLPGAFAGAGAGARVVLLRSEGELARPSAARVRGVVRPVVSTDGIPRWSAQLLRRKGVRPTDDLAEGQRVVLEMRDGQVVVVRGSADVADRPGAAGYAEAAAGAG